MSHPLIRLLDRAKETTSTTGSGTITLGGEVAGFVPISGIGSGNSTYYTLEEASSFEVGIGTYDSVGNIFSRDEVFVSSNEDSSKINLGGNATIFITYPAEKALSKTSGDLVGIGVDPEYPLHVSGTGAFDTIRWSDGTTQTVSATGDINTISGLVTTNTSNILSDSGRIDSNFVYIGGNMADIATNVTNIAATGATNATAIAINSGRIDSNFIYIGGNMADIASTGATNAAAIDMVRDRIASSTGTEHDSYIAFNSDGSLTGIAALKFIEQDYIINRAGSLLVSGDIVNSLPAIGSQDVIIGAGAASNFPTEGGPTGTVIVGSQAATTLVNASNNTIIGCSADIATDSANYAVAVGKGSRASNKSVIIAPTDDFGASSSDFQGYEYSVAVGYGALTGVSSYSVIGIGYRANALSGVGAGSIGIGTSSLATGVYSIGIGYYAGRFGPFSGDSSNSVSLGRYATSKTSGIALGYYALAPEKTFVVSMGSGPSNNLISGVLGDKFVISNAKLGINDITPDAMIDVVAANNTDVGMIIEGAASQTANLTEWQDSSEIVWASVDPTGRISASGGLVLPVNIPSVTANTIYNSGGVLYFNGSGVNGAGGGGGGTTYTAGSGLQLNGTVFDALTATTSTSGITQLQDSATDGTTDKAITPNAVYDISGVLSSDVASTGATNAAAIATNTTNIASTGATNAAAIATNTTNIATNVTNIASTGATNAAAIATNTTNIATNVTNIAATGATNAASAATNATNISTNTTNIAATGATNAAAIATKDNYQYWTLQGDAATTTNVDTIEAVQFTGAGTATVTLGGTDNRIVTISGAADGGTSYTAGTGLTLVGTEFNTAGTGRFADVEIDDRLLFDAAGGVWRGVCSIGAGTPSASDSNYNLRSIYIGENAGGTNTWNSQAIYLGTSAGYLSAGTTNIAIGNTAGYYMGASAIRSIILGTSAAINLEGADNICIGNTAGRTADGDLNIFIGKQAGKLCEGDENIEFVTNGPSTSILDGYSKKIHIANTIVGDAVTQRLAIGSVGSGDLSPDATLEIKPSGATDVGLIVQGATSQSANLTEWQDSSETVLAKIDSSGNLTATTKSFLIDHPTQEGKQLQYGSLEGPEHGVYVRGYTDANTISLPDYWTELVCKDSLTVHLTPKDFAQPNLFVSGVIDNKVYLQSDDQISAYYTINGTRKDIGPLEVESLQS